MISSKGGTQLGAMVEGFAASDLGQSLLNNFIKKEDVPASSPVAPVTAKVNGKGYTNGSAKA